MRIPTPSRRTAGFDELGLRRALSGLMLPLLVASMAFLAALALAGWAGTADLAQDWRAGAASALTVQVPRPAEPAANGGATRLSAVVALLTPAPGIASVHVLTEEELADLLRPWLGGSAEHMALPLPAVIAVHLSGGSAGLTLLARQLADAVPGTVLEDHGRWARRLAALALSLEACALAALVLVSAVAVAVIAVATRAGLAARRQAIEIVYGLGATDGFIAGRFAHRATWLAGVGGLAGTLIAVPVLLVLANLAAPFTGRSSDLTTTNAVLSALPPILWLAVGGLPVAAAAIGFLTAQGTVRRWLRRLP